MMSLVPCLNGLLWSRGSLQVPEHRGKHTRRGGPAGGIHALSSTDCIKDPEGIFNFMHPGRAQTLDTSHCTEEGVRDSPGTWPGLYVVPAQGTVDRYVLLVSSVGDLVKQTGKFQGKLLGQTPMPVLVGPLLSW